MIQAVMVMNKRQLIVQKQFVQDEKAVIRELKHEYSKTLAEINDRIKVLQSGEMTQAKIYQLQYQLSLRTQISSILDKMQSNNYQTVQAYLNGCYKEGFVGAMYDLQGQGIPLAFPIDQNQAVKAVQLDSKVSQGLYARMGVNVNELKKKISDEIARGISSGLSYERIAGNLQWMVNGDYSKSLRIIRTEGHRIQNQSALDAMHKAVNVGASIVKQWDSTLDGNTRDTHRELDGQTVGIDEEFVIPSTGARALYAGGFGDPSEDCNCRCCILQRASWNMDDYDATKMDNESGLLVEFKEKDYQAFKDAYFDAVGS
jgi:hypothetical protein